MKKHLLTLFVAVGVMAMAVSAEAQGRGMGRGMGPGMGRGMGPCGYGAGPGMGRGMGPGGYGAGTGMLGLNPCVVDSPELGLSDDQKAALEMLFEVGQNQAIEAVTARWQQDEELRALVVDPQATEEQIRTKASEKCERMQAGHEAWLDRMLQARNVLTPEQLAKVPEVRNACRSKRFVDPRGDRPYRGALRGYGTW